MNRTILFTILFFSSGLLLGAQTQPLASSFLDPESAGSQTHTSEDDLYASATNALNDGQIDQAIRDFMKVAKMRGRKVDAALYWQAYGLHKLARNTESLSIIDELKQSYPRSRWLRDAYALRAEIGGYSSQPADSNADPDDEMKLLALNSIMQADPEKGLAGAQKLLQGTASLKIKERALFILAESKSDKAQDVLLSVAKGTSQPELQTYAIKWLAVTGGNRNSQALREIYAASTSAEVKKIILRSFIYNHDKDGLLTIIRQEKDPALRREGIRQLGPLRATTELRQIYKEQTDAETKEAVLQAMGVAGDGEGLIEIAKTETNPEIRSRAIRSMGVFGGDAAIPALASIYASGVDLETRKHIIRALFVHRAAKEMVALARKETNPELKEELVRNLSLMHSPEATDYMMEILNK